MHFIDKLGKFVTPDVKAGASVELGRAPIFLELSAMAIFRLGYLDFRC